MVRPDPHADARPGGERPARLQEPIEAFVAHLRYARNLSPHTADAYRADLVRLVDWLLRSGALRAGHEDWNQLRAAHLRMYLAQRHRSGISGRSLQRELSSVRAFFRFRRQALARSAERAETGVASATPDPTVGVRTPRLPRRLPRALDVERAARLVEVDGDRWIDRRDRAMLELMYSCGLRLQETAGLDLAAVDMRERRLTVGVAIAKGRRERLLPIGAKADHALRQWLSVRTRIARPGEAALFVARDGTRLGHRAIQKRFKLRGVQKGLDTPVHPHMLRHSFASHLLESSGDLRAVQELLGHADIGSTQVYTHLDFQHLAAVYDAAHPRARSSRKGRVGGAARTGDPGVADRSETQGVNGGIDAARESD